MHTAAVTACLAASLAGLTGGSSTAAAQPGSAPAAAPAAPPPPGEADPRSEGLALSLSLVGTAATWGVTALGIHMMRSGDSDGDVALVGLLTSFVAPSVGHWYASEGWGSTWGMAIRVTALAPFVAGGVMVLWNQRHEVGKGFLLGAGAIYAAGSIYDIATAPRTARRHNARRELAVAPMIAPGSAGVALGGRF